MKQMILLLAGLVFAAPVLAAPSVPVKCAANEERVWVYSNLTTWDVSARLKCGTSVDVLGVEKGYVRVRTADGNEGYVPFTAVPQSDLSRIIVAVPVPAMTVTGVARANVQVANAQPVMPAMDLMRVAEAAPIPPQPATPPQGSPVPPSNAVPPTAPAPIPDAVPAEQNRPAQPQLPSPAHAPIPAPAPSAPAGVAMTNVTPQRAVITTASTAAPVAVPQIKVTTVADTRTQVIQAQTSTPSARENATPVVEKASGAALMTAQEPAATAVKPAKYMMIMRKSGSEAVRTPEFSDDDEDLPPSSTAASEDLSACSVYFSAYGVTPMQYKWIADERGKHFPGVCPAPEPSMVDYVVIFTHDMNYFTTTLPDAIHTDRNGFSDWTPVTSVDDTQIPVSLLDKAHHEYAWVFRVHRGTFDPGNFTSRRRPQYTKTESRSSKSIEDAMEFMADSSKQ